MNNQEPRPISQREVYEKQFKHCFIDLQRVGYKGRMLCEDDIIRLSNIFAVKTTVREWKRNIENYKTYKSIEGI